MKIVFAGTPEFALPSLGALFESKHELLAVYTQPDRPSGRGRKIALSPVKSWALERNIPVYQPLNFKTENALQDLRQLAPDILVVIAYGIILPLSVLNIPSFGCVNVHASLLPRWRGASPIQHAILHGDKETGVTIMQMDAGMDTGAILTQVACSIAATDTAQCLHDRLATLAIAPLLETLSMIAKKEDKPRAQPLEGVTYAPKIDKQDAAIRWSNTAEEIFNQIRAFHPWPIAWTQAGENILRIHAAKVVDSSDANAAVGTILSLDKSGMQVATGKKAILVERFQFPGGKVITVSDWLNAKRKDLMLDMVLT